MTLSNFSDSLPEGWLAFELSILRRLQFRSVALPFSGETDAWWFDNVRANVENLESPAKRALALDLGMMTGDYALSFEEETRELRQPLSRVFRRLWDTAPAPFDNRQRNAAANKDAREFLAREQ